ncbi:MAG: hypothetical protein V4489_02415 [Chlamydiota bacterium]
MFKDCAVFRLMSSDISTKNNSSCFSSVFSCCFPQPKQEPLSQEDMKSSLIARSAIDDMTENPLRGNRLDNNTSFKNNELDRREK